MLCFKHLRTLPVCGKLKGFQVINGLFKTASNETSGEFSSNEVVKKSFLSKWIPYWKALYRDYRDVAIEVKTTIKSNPVKSSCYAFLAAFLCYCVKTNPDESAFRDSLLSHTNKMNLLSENIRNGEAEKHLIEMEAKSNEDVVRRLNFGLFSLIWLDNFSSDSCLYKAVCPYLEAQYLTFHQRIIDIGFLGHWWLLEKLMEDYDVNPKEWSQSQSQ